MIGGVEQDRVDDLLDRDPADVLSGEEGEGRRRNRRCDGLLDVHDGLGSKGRPPGAPLMLRIHLVEHGAQPAHNVDGIYDAAASRAAWRCRCVFSSKGARDDVGRMTCGVGKGWDDEANDAELLCDG